MDCTRLYTLLTALTLLLSSVLCSPIKFTDEHDLQERSRSLNPQEEARIFHAHAIKKRKKKKLLHCLLSLQRNNPQVDARTLFFNYMNIEYNQHGGGGGAYHDDAGSGGFNNCLSQLGGGGGGNYGNGDGDDSSGLGGIGEGINNLGSLVGQVGQVPSNLVSSVGDGIKPVFENPERYLMRYIFRPLYRSLRPLYRLF